MFAGCGVRAVEVKVLSEQEFTGEFMSEQKHYYTDGKNAQIVIALVKPAGRQ